MAIEYNCDKCEHQDTDICDDCSVLWSDGCSSCSCHIAPPCSYCVEMKFEEVRMKTRYEFIEFLKSDRSLRRKTKVWRCISIKTSTLLGEVEWHGPWRQYCFFPSDRTIFNKQCLTDIAEFLSNVNTEHHK